MTSQDSSSPTGQWQPPTGAGRAVKSTEGKGWAVADKATGGCLMVAGWIGAILCAIVGVLLFKVGGGQGWLFGTLFIVGAIGLAITAVSRS